MKGKFMFEAMWLYTLVRSIEKETLKIITGA